MMLDKFLYPSYLVGCNITGPSEFGKSCFQTIVILNVPDDFGKVNINSPSQNQEFYHRLEKCFSNTLPKNIIQNILEEEVLHLLIEELVYDDNLESRKNKNI